MSAYQLLLVKSLITYVQCMRLIDMCTLQPNYTVYADENYKQHSSTGVHLLQENEF